MCVQHATSSHGQPQPINHWLLISRLVPRCLKDIIGIGMIHLMCICTYRSEISRSPLKLSHWCSGCSRLLSHRFLAKMRLCVARRFDVRTNNIWNNFNLKRLSCLRSSFEWFRVDVPPATRCCCEHVGLCLWSWIESRCCIRRCKFQIELCNHTHIPYWKGLGNN